MKNMYELQHRKTELVFVSLPNAVQQLAAQRSGWCVRKVGIRRSSSQPQKRQNKKATTL